MERWCWKEKVEKGTSLEKAFENFNWCEISEENKDDHLEEKRIQKLIKDLQRKIRAEKESEIRIALLQAVRNLESKLESK